MSDALRELTRDDDCTTVQLVPQVLRTVGRYEILGELGRGAMGVVYLALQTDLARPVALKELAAFGAGDPLLVRRFVQESRLASSLTHPNIVTVHDYFEHGGLPYISMELADRGSLRRSSANLTLAQVAGVLESVLAGLAHAAQRGIVHRDIKPENIVVTADGMVKITDFGIAKALNRLSTMNMTVGAIGTPAYFAPEQARGEQAGPPADLYAVGVMAHEMLVGRLPAPALRRLVHDPGVSPLAVDPTLDGGLSAWVQRMLEIEPSQRYADATSAWADLEEHVIRLLGPRWRRDARLPDAGPQQALTDHSTNAAADATPAPVRSASENDHEVPVSRRRASRRAWMVTAAAALAVVAVGTVVLFTNGDAGPRGGLVLKAGAAGCVSEADRDFGCASANGLYGAHGVAVSPDGEHVYVASFDNSALAAFDRDAESGSLTPQTGGAPGRAGCFALDGAAGACTKLRALGGAEAAAVSRDGRSVYVASVSSSALVLFDRDAASGSLTPRSGAAACFARDEAGCTRAVALGGAGAVAVSPDNKNVYVAANDSDAVAVFDRDPDSGALKQKAAGAACVSDYGRGSCVGAPPLDGPESVTVSPDGKSVYVASGNSEAVTVFDRGRDGKLSIKSGRAGCLSATGSDGSCAVAPAIDIGSGANSMTVSPDGKNVYVASQGSGVVAVLDRDKSGRLTAKPGVDGCIAENDDGRCTAAPGLGDGTSVTVSADGTSVYVASYERGAVTAFDRDDRGGGLRLKPGRTGCISKNGSGDRCATAPTLDGATGVALSPDGRSVYVAGYGADAVTVLDRR